jgi:hypothetical protein
VLGGGGDEGWVGRVEVKGNEEGGMEGGGRERERERERERQLLHGGAAEQRRV